MRRSPPSAALAIALLTCAGFAIGTTQAGRDGPYRIVPGPRAGRGEALPPGGPSRFTIGGLTVEIESLEPGARAAFVRTLAPGAADPFAPPPGGAEAFHAFRVAFENRSAEDVSFQPGNVLLITDRQDHLRSIDLTDLYRVAARAPSADAQAAMDAARPFIFDSATIVPRGRGLARLLVFPPLPAKWKEFRVLFSFLQIGAETRSLSFQFHKQVPKD